MTYLIYQSLLYTALVIYAYFRIDRHEVDFKTAWNLVLIIMVGGFIGGRLFHVVYEYPSLYLEHPMQILRFWEGGFVFFGGFLVAMAGFAGYIFWKHEPFLRWADFFAPIIALGYAFGRLGCLIAGCCYGNFCDAPWAIQNRHPTQVYAFITEGLLFLYLIKKEKSHPPAGKIFSLWLIWHGVGRMVMEFYRADFRGAQFGGLSVSSWISLVILSIGFALYIGLTPIKRRS
ncbi:MAG: prolipoprotein diacylglyceryl transferase [Bdellovibrionaceae bacterium]|nr:prolipoprotein diacylglyceryl transferase [Pseudobdellovibrionaceae bacterium]